MVLPAEKIKIDTANLAKANTLIEESRKLLDSATQQKEELLIEFRLTDDEDDKNKIYEELSEVSKLKDYAEEKFRRLSAIKEMIENRLGRK